MFGIGGFELFLILLFGFLIFGPDKLPAVAKTVGKAIAKFRNAQEEMSGVLKDQVFDKDSDEPFKNPMDVIDKAAVKAQKGAATAKETAVKAHDAVKKATTKMSEAAAEKDRTEQGSQSNGAEPAAQEEPASGQAGEQPAEQAEERPLTFAERKAAYDRERAERKAAEAAAAEEGKKIISEAADQPASVASASTESPVSDTQKEA